MNWRNLYLTGTLIVIFAGGLCAHVTLDTPNGGETLIGNEIFQITWHPSPYHELGDWDLYLSLDGAAGTYTPIILDLYPGDLTPTGSTVLYNWTVDDVNSTNAYVKVVQDGLSGEWDDISDASFTIVPEPATVFVVSLGLPLLLKKRK